MLVIKIGIETSQVHRASVSGRKFFHRRLLAGHGKIVGKMLEFIGIGKLGLMFDYEIDSTDFRIVRLV